MPVWMSSVTSQPIFDGVLWWYPLWDDAAPDDRCSFCRGPLPPIDKLLILFRHPSVSTNPPWRAHICEACTPAALTALTTPRRSRKKRRRVMENKKRA